MFDWKVVGLVAGMFAFGGMIGCTGVEDDDDGTPDDTPAASYSCDPSDASYSEADCPALESMYFDDTFLDVTCSGTDSDTEWYIDMQNWGWADDVLVPEVTIIDNPDWGYDNDCDVWWETHELDFSSEDVNWDTGENTQEWYRYDLSKVGSYDAQTDNVSTIFACESLDFYTYTFCAWDYYYADEVCVTIGANASIYANAACGF